MAGLTPQQFQQMGGQISDTQTDLSHLPPPPKGVKGLAPADFANQGGQFQQPLNQGNFSNSKQALGQSNELHFSLMDSILSAGSSVAGAIGDFESQAATGVAKGLVVDPIVGASKLLGIKNQGIDILSQKAENTDKGTIGKNIGEIAGNIAGFAIPGGGEAKVALKGASLVDKGLELANLGEKATKVIGGVAKTGIKAVTSGATAAGVQTLQTGDVKQGEGMGVVGGLFGGIGQALESFGGGLLKSLQKSGFKLSPAQEAKAAQKADSAAQFMTDNKILGSDNTKFSKLEKINTNMEDAIQNSLPDKLQVPRDSVINHINESIESLKTQDPAKYTAAKNDAKDAIEILKSKGDSVSIKDTLLSKRSYGKQAFKQSIFRDPKVVSEGSYAIEQGFQKAMNDILESTNTKINVPENLKSFFAGAKQVSLPDFNKVYSNAISAKNLTNIGRFKKDSGLVGRLFGLWAGESLGQAIAPGLVGKIAFGGVGEVASTRLPSFLRNLSERALSSNKGVNRLGKTVMGASTPDVTAPQNQEQQ